MRVISQDGAYVVTKVTGPYHNYLAIVLRKEEETSNEQIVIDLNNCENGNLDPDLVRNFTNIGIANANQDFGVSYNAREIRFISDDSPPEDRYAELAYRIIEVLHMDDYLL